MKTLIFYTAVLVFITARCCAQEIIRHGSADSVQKRSVTLSAGSQFAASGSKQFWWGKHWRDEWIKPAGFQVFDLDTMAGGLTPLKRGGGHETKSLRMLGKNGKEYVLRTIDKNLDALVPEEFKGSFVNDVVNDQISTAHPYGPLVVAALASSIGILHTNPVIGYVTESPRLDSFNNDFANRLCLFEERPSGDGWKNTSLTNFAGNIINTEDLLIKLTEDNKKQVDQKEFLKVRLFDMLINDWDRHEDQWVWASQKKDGKTIYTPFGRDRDQSFSKTDGVNLYLLSRRWALRSLQNMDPTIRDVIGTNIAARFLDKKFTTELTKEDWESTIISLQQLLTDSVISTALKQMPPPIYDLSGDFLFQRLRQRRNNMVSFGMRYYRILNKEVTITGSDERELITIHKITDNTTEIIIQDLNKKNLPGDTLYRRLFDHAVTKEINLYGLAGNDQFVFTGKGRNNITSRVIGGDGTDSFSDSTTDINSGKKSKIYDSGTEKPATLKTLRYRSTTDTSLTTYNPKSFKYDWWIPLIIPGYNPDDGFIIGAGIIYKKRQWNKTPFGWQQSVGAIYAAATGAWSLFYKGKFKQALGKWDLDLTANYNAPGYVVNFYGFGNETKLLTKDKDFFRVRATSLFFNPAVSYSWKKNLLMTGLVFNSLKVQSNENKFISQTSSIDTSVFSTKYFAGANFFYAFNTTNNSQYPTKGILYQAGTSYWINLKENKKDFVNLQSNFTFYFSPFKRITLAHRTGASTNIGDYEFYQANTIGGSENLRGYWRTRFTGSTSFYQNTDLRINITYLKGYVLRGILGVYGFFDDGRVWIKGEHSSNLHYGYGGGIYFIPYNALAINLSYATSKEANVFTFRTGFLF